MDIHIGRLIEERIKEVGMTKAEFGRRINTSRQNVNTLLRKESLDTRLLKKIGRVLDYDFFRFFLRPGFGPTLGSSEDEPTQGPIVKLVVELSGLQQEKLLEILFGSMAHDFLQGLK